MHDAYSFDTVRRVLVGTDFSASATWAVERGARFARAGGGTLELMHVIPARDGPVDRVQGRPVAREDPIAGAMHALRALADGVRARFDLPVNAHVAVGSPDIAIAKRAEATDADLVVVGAHRDRPVRDLFFDATAQRLRRSLRAPLLIARNPATPEVDSVLVAVDLDTASARAAHAAARLFPEAALHFVHVSHRAWSGRLSMAGVDAETILAHRNETALRTRRELDAFIEANGLQRRHASSSVRLGHVATSVRAVAEELGVSVVVFGPSGKSRVEAQVLGRVTEHFLGGAGSDVLLAGAGTPRPDRRPGSTRRRDLESAAAST